MADKGRGGGAPGKGNPGGERGGNRAGHRDREEQTKKAQSQQSFGADPMRGKPPQ